ncbi:MAG: SH3 domain-containing protein [Aristaeellaceae bacterium]
MRKLTIYRRLFYDADCYKAATVQKQCGVQVHSTGANNPYLKRYVGPDDGRLGRNQYGNHSNQPGSDVCASAYIGRLQDGTVVCYQTLPWEYRCWLSGRGTNGNANRLGYIGFEICEDNLKNEEYFREAVMGVSVNLTAYLCVLCGTNPYAVVNPFKQGNALAVMDHSELNGLKLASNHGDISHWLAKYGLTMQDYRREVEKAIAEGVDVNYIDCDNSSESEGEPMYQAKVTCPGTFLNMRSAKSKTASVVKRLNKGAIVDVLNDTDQDWWYVRQDGVYGYAMTHSGTQVYITPIGDTSDAPTDSENTDDGSTVSVSRLELQSIHDMIGKMLGVGM